MSAFYVSNRKDGFVLSGSILAKSKFYGNSLSAILDGVGRLMFLKRGEDYLLTMPYAHCKGTIAVVFAGSTSATCNLLFFNLPIVHLFNSLFPVVPGLTRYPCSFFLHLL